MDKDLTRKYLTGSETLNEQEMENFWVTTSLKYPHKGEFPIREGEHSQELVLINSELSYAHY